MQAVDGVGEFCLGRLAGLEFFPDVAKRFALIGGQHAEETIGGLLLAGGFVDICGLVVAVGVSGVDLDDIVDKGHLHGSEEVDRRVAVFTEQNDHRRKVPGVLGGILGSSLGAVAGVGAPEDLLEFVDLKGEGDLLFEAVHWFEHTRRVSDLKRDSRDGRRRYIDEMSLSALPLSYCTNVHPGRSVAEVEGGLDRYTAPVQRALGRPVGAGLWLAQPVVDELLASNGVAAFASRLRGRGLTCYTLNAFPYGDFHKARVKEQVYLPDWSDPLRTLYTERCAGILAEFLPAEGEGSISTLPLGFKPLNHEVGFLDACVEQLLGTAMALAKLKARTGKMIRLAIEPEPFCWIETTKETIDLFDFIWRAAEKRDLEEAAREHLGVCYDVCHQAVEFEDAATSIAAIDAAGIRINKVQISCALELAEVSAREALRKYIEPRYLHQTMARRRDGTIVRALDLDDELVTGAPGDFSTAAPWRVHFHVPVSAERMGSLGTTRGAIPEALWAIAKLTYAPHLEVETYTWEVLPGSEIDLVSGLAEELRATHEMLGNGPA